MKQACKRRKCDEKTGLERKDGREKKETKMDRSAEKVNKHQPKNTRERKGPDNENGSAILDQE